MKKILALIVIVTFFLFGCQEADNPLVPLNNNETELTSLNQPNWIALPKSDNMSIESHFSSKRRIDGKRGGDVHIREEFIGGIHGKVKIDARIHFPRKAFWGRRDITLIIDSENGLTTFYPHMQFNRSAEYNLRIEGLDLSNVDPNNIDFVYQAENGAIEKVRYDKLKVDIARGIIEVRRARLNHFSRYGFVN